MRKISLVILLVLACNVSTSTLERVTESAGLTDAKATGWAPLSCSKGDTFKTHFTAKNAHGKKVVGAVCCGYLKDCTVRFE